MTEMNSNPYEDNKYMEDGNEVQSKTTINRSNYIEFNEH